MSLDGLSHRVMKYLSVDSLAPELEDAKRRVDSFSIFMTGREHL